MFRELLILEEAFCVFIWSSSAYQISIDSVELVLTSYNEEIASCEGHLWFTDIHFFDGDWGAIDIGLEDCVLFVLFGVIFILGEVVGYHVYCRYLETLLILLDCPYFINFVAGMEIGN